MVATAALAAGRVTAADVDVASYLNSQLATKPQVLVNVTKYRSVQICEARPDEGPGVRECHHEDQPYVQQVPSLLSVTNANIIQVSNVNFDKANATLLPEQAMVGRLDYHDCGPGNFSASETLAFSGTKGWTVTKTQGISATLGISHSDTISGGSRHW
jgi:hypothetical protein